jgi:manganese transport protein
MGEFAISPVWAATAWLIASLIVILNVKLLFDTIAG